MENQIQQTTETTSQVTYAGFWWRFLAFIIDDIILGIISSIIILPIWAAMGVSIYSMFQGDNHYADDEVALELIAPLMGAIALTSIISIVLQWLYFALMESSKQQGTLGKMALGIKVTDMEGNRISFARATGRFFGKIISGMIIYIGYIMAGFTEKKQALPLIGSGCIGFFYRQRPGSPKTQ